jgi:hypothetical protein
MTGSAQTVNLKDVRDHPPSHLPVDLLLQALHGADVQVPYLTAGYADKMVMMIRIGAKVVIELPVWMDDLADHTAVCQLLQITVDGGKPKASEVLLEVQADLLRADIGARGCHIIEDCQPLRGDLEPEFPQNAGEIMGHGN